MIGTLKIPLYWEMRNYKLVRAVLTVWTNVARYWKIKWTAKSRRNGEWYRQTLRDTYLSVTLCKLIFILWWLKMRIHYSWLSALLILVVGSLYSQTPSTPSVTPSPKPTTSSKWCVPKTSGVSDAQLQENLDYACGHGIDCSPIQPGGACFDPNTVASHAAYAMNLYYHTVGTDPINCDFSQTATLTSTNPSKFP